MLRRVSKTSLVIAALGVAALSSTATRAHAADPEAGNVGRETSAPLYTLAVDSDAPETISYEALAARIASDLGSAPGSLKRATDATPTRAAISIVYRSSDNRLTVRVVHATPPSGTTSRVLERTVEARGDAAAVQREAVLLATNLARDEARELLDALATRPPKAEPKTVTETPAPKPDPNATKPAEQKEPEQPQPTAPVVFSLVYPLATNWGKPDVATPFSLSLVYGRVGTVQAFSISSAVTHATRGVDGVQLAAGAAISGGHVTGAQIAPIVVAKEDLRGAQLSTVSVARDVQGAQIGVVGVGRDFEGAGINVINVGRDVDGAQIGVINVGRKVRGAQIGVVNVAEEVDGAAVGVVSVTKTGVHPIVWGSNLQYINAGFKFSTRYLYTVLAFTAGTNESKNLKDAGGTAGLGVHLPLGRFDLDAETLYSSSSPQGDLDKAWNSWIHYRALAGFSVYERLRFFAGGGVRMAVSVDVGSTALRPEAVAGVQF